MAGTTLTIIQVSIGVLVAVAAVLLVTISLPKEEEKTSPSSESLKNLKDEPSEPKMVRDSSESAIRDDNPSEPSISDISSEAVFDNKSSEPDLDEELSELPTAKESPELTVNEDTLKTSAAAESSDKESATESKPTTAKESMEERTVEIMTKLGKVKGSEQAISDSRIIYAFKGIPYAQSPVDGLRFKAPVPIEPWSEVKGGQTPPACPQMDFVALRANKTKVIGEEDCLYLNVYVPKDSAPDLPVMVFIHGGAFYLGSADTVGGTPKFLLTKDVMLVSIQYRLGVLGFLSTGDSMIPGNFGMKDQSLALRWVQENIREFGGNPEQVTIFGQSAGGASTHMHLLTPYSEGLFKRAIFMSGTALAPWAIRQNPRDIASNYGKLIGCIDEGDQLDSGTLLACLSKASVEDIILAGTGLAVWQTLPFPMVPRVDGDYFPDQPAQLLKSGLFHNVDIMIGVTANEMVSQVIALIQNEAAKKEFLTKFDLLAPLLCGLDEEDSGPSIMKRAFYNYMDEIEISENYFEELDQLFSDCCMAISNDESVLLHVKDENRNVYAYELEYQGKKNLLDHFNMSIDKDFVPHAADLQFLFNNILGYPDSDDVTDILVSEIMVQLWTDFAITGNPTPDLSLGFKWLPMAKDSYHYLGIGPAPSMRNDKRAQRREFWRRQPTLTNKILHTELSTDDLTPAN